MQLGDDCQETQESFRTGAMSGEQAQAMAAHEHLVQFYDSEHELLDAVVPFLAEGLSADDSVVVIATAEHRRALEATLEATDSGLNAARTSGRYTAVDAGQVLDYIRPEGQLQEDALDEVIAGLIPNREANPRPMRVYGEMVALLWDEGESAAALELEQFWNELGERESLTLLCTFPTPRSPSQQQAIRHICRSHSAVMPSVTADDPVLAEPLLTAEFGPHVESPRYVRALLRSTLGNLQFSEDLIERGTLAASELAANAVLHARTSFRLLVQPTESSVWIGVEDGAPLRDPHDVIGRTPHGLGLITALALRWGVTPRSRGKLVWAELPL